MERRETEEEEEKNTPEIPEGDGWRKEKIWKYIYIPSLEINVGELFENLFFRPFTAHYQTTKMAQLSKRHVRIHVLHSSLSRENATALKW